MLLWYKKVVGKVELGWQTSQAVASPSYSKSIEITKKRKKKRNSQLFCLLPNKEKYPPWTRCKKSLKARKHWYREVEKCSRERLAKNETRDILSSEVADAQSRKRQRQMVWLMGSSRLLWKQPSDLTDPPHFYPPTVGWAVTTVSASRCRG